jgi:histidine phosphotransferase ChpT
VTAPDLSALVSARLCHDLISPMGAIGNGLELLQISGNAGAAELELIGESLATALAKLRFYRIAFGPADVEARLTFEEAAQVTDAMFQGRFGVAWAAGGPDMPRPLARLIYLAILCLEKSLPMGGTVRVDVADDAVALAVDGRRTTPPRELWALATEGAPVPELRPDGVQFALLRQALAATGHRIATEFSETRAALRMTSESPMLV